MRGQAVYLLLDLTKCRTGCKFIIVLFLYHSIPVFLSITHEMHRFSLPVRDREKIDALHFCSVLRHETCQPARRRQRSSPGEKGTPLFGLYGYGLQGLESQTGYIISLLSVLNRVSF